MRQIYIFYSPYSGQKCCYDTNGHLLTGPHSGSTPDSGGGNWFVHQTQDILPQIHCCKAAHSNCSQFYALRPSDNCKNFNPDLPGKQRIILVCVQHNLNYYNTLTFYRNSVW